MTNNNNKKCRNCHGTIDFSKCNAERKMFRAKRLELCLKCQDKIFGA